MGSNGTVRGNGVKLLEAPGKSFGKGQFKMVTANQAQAENGYHLYDFKGTLLREEHVERFKQLSWRPRPPNLLSKDEQKRIRKNLREYSKTFDEQDFSKKNRANQAVIEQRRRLLDEWKAWRKGVDELVVVKKTEGDTAESEVIEELVEDVIDESEEVVPEGK